MERTGAAGLAAGGVMRLGGEVRSPRVVAMDDLRSLPQQERAVTFTCRKSGVRRHAFSGPLLLDVAALAGPAFVPNERKDRLRFLISLRGADGHLVVLSWAEIDPEFGNGPVLLGVTRDGLALDDEGPQLVVPGDVCGARNVSGIVELRIFSEPAGR
ncbi:hypothetical protein [Yinghuangia seranimata]|uniref:hypothetical protein n=1 Tax=Yinghuangia seranimata TaxID=408067 RepID=UPI00248C26D2|nr:hypothetical protein [Yinghuangia seranimata]MDI2124617.1 hypothetical protein [Yinghuangia seranimata]